MDIISLLIGVAIVGLGGAGVSVGGKTLRRWRRLGENDPVPISDAIAESGLVEIEGDVRPTESTLESPHFGEECVIYEYKTEERRRRRSANSKSRKTWKTIDSGEASRSFTVEDESGTAYVDPTAASLSLASERTRNTNSRGNPSLNDSTLDMALSVALPIVGSLGSRKRRYTEKRLDVDGHCYIAGAAERPPAGSNADVSISGTDVSTFLISDATEAQTRRRLLLRGLGYTAAGIFAIAFGLNIVGAELL